MTDVNDIFSDLISDTPEINKREFLLEKVKCGESIAPNSKTPWTEKRLQEASDKVIDKLYEKYQNPPPQKVNKQEALQLGKPICPVVIDLYAEGLKSIVDKLPYIGGKYTVNIPRLKSNISANTAFCENIAIKIGFKMIEQMGVNSPLQVGISLASMTWDAIEPVQRKESGVDSENKDE